MKVILISGKAESGKDTFALELKDYLINNNKKVCLAHNADLLKFICSQYFNWDGQKDDKGRTILQQVGTQKVRSQNPDFWVNFLIDLGFLFEDEWDYMLVPDTRFPNEISRWNQAEFDNCTVRIERDNFDNRLSEEQRKHESEIALDDYEFGHYIKNNGSLEEFKTQIKLFGDYILSE